MSRRPSFSALVTIRGPCPPQRSSTSGQRWPRSGYRADTAKKRRSVARTSPDCWPWRFSAQSWLRLAVWGLQHTSATSASLLLNFEAVFTVLLGWLLFREHVGRRVALAVSLMVLAGTCLIVASRADTGGAGWGAIAIVFATLGWALDNTFTRPLADLDPTRVVRWKAGLGAALGFGLSLALGQRFPEVVPAVRCSCAALPATG